MRLRRANNGREMCQLVADENDYHEVVDDYEQRDPMDRYITPSIIRPATGPDQLRLSYMDDLSPLTTEDYIPAPPPPRVNRRPVVTHTESGPMQRHCVNCIS